MSLTDETKNDIVRMFKVGDVAPEEIADATGVPLPAILTILMGAGVTRDSLMGTPVISRVGESVRKFIIEEYLAGARVKEIRRKFKLTETEFWNVLNEEGVPIRKFVITEQLALLRRDAEIISLYRSGMGVFKIAELVGIGQQGMHNVLLKYGEPLRLPSRRTRKRKVEVDAMALLRQMEKDMEGAIDLDEVDEEVEGDEGPGSLGA